MVSPSSPDNRFVIVDIHRGFAVILMFIYHSFYDLTMIGALPYEYMFTDQMVILQRTTMNSFIFCVGISMALAHRRGIRWKGFIKRETIIVGCAAIVSLATYLTYPENWVSFGILHFMAVTSLIILPFARAYWISLVIGCAILIPYFGWGWALPWFKPNPMAFDHVPLFPWIGFAFLGIAAHKPGWHKLVKNPRRLRWLQFLGRHSLIIYLVHQPALVAFFYLSAPVWHQLLNRINGS